MSSLYFSGKYKDKIIKLLIGNEMIVKLLNPEQDPDLDVTEILLGGEWVINGEKVNKQGHIFDYNFVDDTIKEEKTFIFVETDITSIKNEMFAEFNLYICIFAHKHLIRLSHTSSPSVKEVKDAGFYGNRIDVLCDAVDSVLNGDSTFGIGDVSPATMNYMTMYTPSNEYYGKCLKYKVKNYIETSDKCDL